jgi:hypothetical protein
MAKNPVPAEKPPVAVKAGLSEKTVNLIFLLALALLPLILYRDYLTGARMLFGSDYTGTGGYAMREFMANYIRQHGRFALWLPYIYSGLPTAASFYGDMFYPISLVLRLLLPSYVAWTYGFVIQIFLAGMGTYLFVKQLKMPQTVAFVMALAYMFAGSLVSTTHEGHDARLMVCSLLPLVLFFLERGITSGKLLDFLLSGVMFGLQLVSGHIQEAYYTALVIIIYFVFRFVSQVLDDRKAGHPAGRNLKLIGWFVLTMLFVACFVAIQYLPVFGNLKNGVRGATRDYAYATSWAMAPEETFDLITARFSGGLEHYWGRNPFKHHTEYFGILPLILAVAGIVFCWRERKVKFFFWLALFTLLMAWGGHTPLYYLPYYLLPGVSRFRAPSLIFFVTAFSVVVLAAYGLKYLMSLAGSRQPQAAGDKRQGAGPKRQTPRDGFTKFLLWTGGVGVGLLIVFAAGQGAVVSLLSAISHSEASRISDNYSNFLGGMLIATVLILVNLALLYALVRARIKPLLYAALAGFVLVIDLWIVDSQFIQPLSPPAESFKADEVVNFLKQDTTRFRVFPLYYTDPRSGVSKSDEGLLMVHGIENIGGQHPNPPQSYMDFAGIEKTVMFNFPPNLLNRRFMDLLNVKYIISVPLPSDTARYPADQRQAIRMLRQYINQPGITVAWQSQQAIVYRNDSMLPRAFLVPGYEVRTGKDAVIARLKEPSFDPRRTVVLTTEPGVKSNDSGPIQGSVNISSYEPDRVVVQATLDRPGFLVLADNFHPDWKALDNGKPVNVLCADQTLQAVFLESGSHRVEFQFRSKYFKLGSRLTLLACLVLVVMIVATAWSDGRTRRKTR